ncbi:MAG: Ig-like domain-containing protein [Lentihominibacter sp.]
MKRIGAIVCAMMMVMALAAPAVFAASDNGAGAADKSGFTMISSSPEDGTEGVAVDNLSVKIYFSKDMKPKNDKVRKANAKEFKLKDSEGSKIPVRVYYSDEEEGLLLVAADTFSSKDTDKIKSDETYTLTIGEGLQASDGTKFGKTQTISLKTLNQSRSTFIYMILMVLMMVGMVFFTIRGTKKEEEKKKEEKHLKDGVNPYKEAKKSGKSVEEVVAKEAKKKAKQEEALKRQKEKEAEIEAEIIEKIRKERNKRVSAPKSIKDAGSSIRIKVITDEGKKVEQPKKAVSGTNKGTTHPKNRKGKNKNKKKSGK